MGYIYISMIIGYIFSWYHIQLLYSMEKLRIYMIIGYNWCISSNSHPIAILDIMISYPILIYIHIYDITLLQSDWYNGINVLPHCRDPSKKDDKHSPVFSSLLLIRKPEPSVQLWGAGWICTIQSGHNKPQRSGCHHESVENEILAEVVASRVFEQLQVLITTKLNSVIHRSEIVYT